MRIALISYEYPPHIYGGIGNYTRQAALMLCRRGHDVEVFAGCAERSYEEVVEGVRVHHGQCRDRWQFASVAVDLFARQHALQPFDVVEAPELASEGREIFQRFPDVPSVVRLHTPSYLAAWVDRCSFGKIAALLQSLRYGLAEVVRARPPRNGLKFWREHVSFNSWYRCESDRERNTALLADVVASPSTRLAMELIRDWQIAPHSVRVLPYPHSPDQRALRLPFPERKVRTICFYGGIKAFKGVDILARAIPRVFRRHPHVRFVFAGSSQVSPVRDMSLAAFLKGSTCSWENMEGWLRRKLAPFGDGVQFRGQLNSAGILALLDESDLCVFPSRFDNFPNACLEAMGAGRPIVATRSGGMEEMLAPADAGWLVAPGSHTELAQAICGMIENDEMRLGMARRARQRVLTAYGEEVIGPEHERLYTEAVRLATDTSEHQMKLKQ